MASTFQVELEGVPYLLFSQLKDEAAVSAFLRRLARQARLHASRGPRRPGRAAGSLPAGERSARCGRVRQGDRHPYAVRGAGRAAASHPPIFTPSWAGRPSPPPASPPTSPYPHGDCAEVLRPSVGVLLPRRPVDWGGGVQVRMVLLLAFPEASAGLFPALCHIVTDEGARWTRRSGAAPGREVARCLCRLIWRCFRGGPTAAGLSGGTPGGKPPDPPLPPVLHASPPYL